jgi:hypothetical protein
LTACEAVNSTSSSDLQRIEWMKDYSFCKCLTYSFGDSLSNEIQKIDHSISTLTDIADIWGNFPELDSLAKSYSGSLPESQLLDYQGMKPYMFRCLEYRRSESLDSLIDVVLIKEK